MDKRDVLLKQSKGRRVNVLTVGVFLTLIGLTLSLSTYYFQNKTFEKEVLLQTSPRSAINLSDPRELEENAFPINSSNVGTSKRNEEIDTFFTLFEINEPLLNNFARHLEFGGDARKVLSIADLVFEQVDNGLDPTKTISTFDDELNSLKAGIDERVTDLLDSMGEALKLGQSDLYTLSLRTLLSMNIDDSMYQEYVEFQNRQERYFTVLQMARAHERSSRYEEALEAYTQIKLFNPPIYHFGNLEAQLKTNIFNQSVERLVRDIENEIEKSKYDEAISLMDKLLKLDPGNSYSLARLPEVEQLELQKQITDNIEKGNNLISNEQYSEALIYFQDVVALAPKHEEASSAVSSIEHLLLIQSQLENLLDAPERLSDPNVANYAISIIDSYEKSNLQSEKIDQFITNIQGHMNSRTASREITIISDNKSTIEVVGLGFVRPTLKRIINLIPKSYSLNISCPGHQDHILNIVIPPEPEPFSVVEAFCGKEL